jgi:hypothetical protein
MPYTPLAVAICRTCVEIGAARNRLRHITSRPENACRPRYARSNTRGGYIPLWTPPEIRGTEIRGPEKTHHGGPASATRNPTLRLKSRAPDPLRKAQRTSRGAYQKAPPRRTRDSSSGASKFSRPSSGLYGYLLHRLPVHSRTFPAISRQP